MGGVADDEGGELLTLSRQPKNPAPLVLESAPKSSA